MKLLLDENLPKRLKKDFSTQHEIFTVRDMSWNGKTNGELLQLMIADNFDILLAFDKNLQYQQNFRQYPIPVLVLNAPDNTCLSLQKLLPGLNKKLNTTLTSGVTEVKE